MFFVAIIINFLLMAWLYPEVFVRFDSRLVQGFDTVVSMQSAFWMTGQWYQGGVQLFDRFDALSSTYTHLTTGVYNIFNTMIAAGFWVLSLFSDEPGKLFHHWFLFAFQGIGVILRTCGAYALGYYLSKSRFAALITSVYVNLFCALVFIHMGGLMINHLFSLLPLLLFCYAYYWDTRKSDAIVAIFLLTVLAISMAPLYALGYFYQTVHLYVLEMCWMWIFIDRCKRPLWVKGNITMVKFLWIMLLSVIVLLPVLFFAKDLGASFQVDGSGLGGTHGRFNRIFNPIAMMHDTARYYVPPKEIFWHALDFTQNAWMLNGPFLGVGVMILGLMGLILGKHQFKHAFWIASLTMLFLNVNPIEHPLLSWAHWIDGLTNPFCFLVRSFHFAMLAWLMSWGIPVSLGLKACADLVQGKVGGLYGKRLKVVKGILIMALMASLLITVVPVKVYVIAMLLIAIFFLFLFDSPLITQKRIALGIVFFVLFLGIDLFVLKKYINTKSNDMNWAYWDGLSVKPRVFGPMYETTPKILDYQNPKILPFRFYYRGDPNLIFPLLSEHGGIFGVFYHYVALPERIKREACIYVPRWSIFRNADKDAPMLEYLHRDERMMYMAYDGVVADQVNYNKVLDAGKDRSIVLVGEGFEDKVKDPRMLTESPLDHPQFTQMQYKFDLGDASKKKAANGELMQWRLPKDFPKYLATDVFTLDQQMLRLNINGFDYVPAQGALVIPGTFDVNNIRDGYLTAYVPSDLSNQTTIKATLTSFHPAEILDVWKNTQDQVGLTYNATHAGWWVMHMPYDPKWQLFVNGVKMPLARIDRYFIGTPLGAGEHQILLTYWPQSPLRVLIPLSIVCAFILFYYLVYFVWTRYEQR